MKDAIAVIGLGYVGLPLGLLASSKGYRVYGIDIDESKVESLSQGVTTFLDKKIKEQLTDSLQAECISFHSDFTVVPSVSIFIICVPTPVHIDHTPDLGPVESAVRFVGSVLKRGQLVILESTVNPGVSEEFVVPLLQEESGLVAGKDFYVAHCPERINPGDEKWHTENIPRVLGSFDERGLALAHAFYSSILTAKVFLMKSLKEAEAVKIVENSFRDVNIAFVNELAMSFSRLGIDVMRVLEGASTKPFGFMLHRPSCGVGGHCIPIDPYYLIDYAEKNGFHHEFLALARRINNHMPQFTVEQLQQALAEHKLVANGMNIAVLGLSYKPNVDDCRESPAFEIIRHLQHLGAKVRTYDPYTPKERSVETLNEALSGVQAVIIATGHEQFKALTAHFFKKYDIKAVVDGANCLVKEQFIGTDIAYRGIGRKSDVPVKASDNS